MKWYLLCTNACSKSEMVKKNISSCLVYFKCCSALLSIIKYLAEAVDLVHNPQQGGCKLKVIAASHLLGLNLSRQYASLPFMHSVLMLPSVPTFSKANITAHSALEGFQLEVGVKMQL